MIHEEKPKTEEVASAVASKAAHATLKQRAVFDSVQTKLHMQLSNMRTQLPPLKPSKSFLDKSC
ncbi:hypothetical protein PIB30_075812, partial [Stylosanthes scabra]|nr:hypothetical protein [Stylosanthes scabra]